MDLTVAPHIYRVVSVHKSERFLIEIFIHLQKIVIDCATNSFRGKIDKITEIG